MSHYLPIYVDSVSVCLVRLAKQPSARVAEAESSFSPKGFCETYYLSIYLDFVAKQACVLSVLLSQQLLVWQAEASFSLMGPLARSVPHLCLSIYLYLEAVSHRTER